MRRRFVTLVVSLAMSGMLVVAGSELPAGQALAVRTASVSLMGAHPDGVGFYTVSIADSRPASKLVLYVNGHREGTAVVSARRRALFRYVELEGIGKLSLAEVRARSRGGHYLVPLHYSRYFEAVQGRVRFS